MRHDLLRAAAKKRAGGGAGSDPYFSSVVLLMHMDGTDGSATFVDEIGNTVTASGNAHIETSEKKFGTASAQFDGSGDYLTVNITGHSFGSGQFTVELWALLGDLTKQHTTLLDLSVGVTATPATLNVFGPTGSIPNSFTWYDGSVHNASTGITPQTGLWYHIAVARDSGGTSRLFVDGTIRASWTDVTNYTLGSTPRIGHSSYSALRDLTGYIDEVRITKGVARYTANFTPPDAPFPDN